MTDFKNKQSEILHEILYGSVLTLEEHTILDNLVENRLYQLQSREDDSPEEVKQLQDLYMKLGRIFKKELGK